MSEQETTTRAGGAHRITTLLMGFRISDALRQRGYANYSLSVICTLFAR